MEVVGVVVDGDIDDFDVVGAVVVPSFLRFSSSISCRLDFCVLIVFVKF